VSGTTNAQKRFFGRDLHEFGDKKSQDWLQRLPKEIPCTVTAVNYPFVTVQANMNATPFTLPKITVPQSQSAYFREPTQIGDEGYLSVSDYYLGGVSGLGGGTADLTPRGNLSTGVFRPITRKSFAPMVDPNKAQVNGPGGFVCQNNAGTVSVIADDASITFTVPGLTVVMNSSGVTINGALIVTGGASLNGGVNGAMAATGEVTAKAGTGNSVGLSTHTTSGVATGTGTSGAPTPGT
jgi:hypothetical protein